MMQRQPRAGDNSRFAAWLLSSDNRDDIGLLGMQCCTRQL
jgi:hypothetical protein